MSMTAPVTGGAGFVGALGHYKRSKFLAEGHLLAARRGVVGERYILGNANMSLRAKPQRPIEDALRRAVEWYREHGYV